MVLGAVAPRELAEDGTGGGWEEDGRRTGGGRDAFKTSTHTPKSGGKMTDCLFRITHAGHQRSVGGFRGLLELGNDDFSGNRQNLGPGRPAGTSF